MTGFADARRVEALIEGIDRFNATPGQGTTRLTYSPAYAQARNFVASQMVEAGLAVREDAVGNVFGRIEGTNPGLAPILVGSHLDSVPNGGRFDGPAGVVAGIETAFLFRDLGLRPERPVEVIAMIEEEGARFGGGLFGSRLLTGQVDPATLEDLRDDDGISAAATMRDYGLDPAGAAQAALAPGAIHAFLELHIEQGPVLEAEGRDIAIVDRIVGLAQLKVTVRGRAGHAGTTPMDQRCDALVGAVGILSQLPDLARQVGRDSVLTVGKMEVLPGGANVIPDHVWFSVDLRAPAEADVRQLIDMVRATAAHAQGNGLTCTVEQQLYAAPTPLSGQIHAALTGQADALGVSHRVMVSGAGHDAMIMAGVAPTGLIFVPSRGGISHAPEEWTDYVQLARGIDVIFATIRQMSNARPG
ncbi:Zn-dependent hydrolase [Paracoccus liaowanqingii]|uniref:Zn-dependent hydrolase n=1 Tax=Paracoccus liaowanqingii TaxID=2560053 RepID=A0A4P7HKW9_9RHOB|nr:Zn-dependent hydrolase [Paracoccus liaowanqingii]QBX34796.1 Zn-dependent hydrolase [Paracoccus liaowanqingii]